MEYRGYEIKPSAERLGYFVVVKDGCNALPGAQFPVNVDQARRCIDTLEMAKGDVSLYWLLMGQAGLNTTYFDKSEKERAAVIANEFMEAKITVWRDGTITYGLHMGVNPKEALALAAGLVKAAHAALNLDDVSRIITA